MDETPPTPPTSKALVPLLLGVVVLLLLSNGAWAVFLVSQANPSEPSQDSESSTPAAEMGPMVSLEPLVVNLNEPGSPRYLRVSITLELRDERARKDLQDRKIPLRDAILRHLSDLDTERLQSAQDKSRLQLELLAISEELFSSPIIQGIYFTEFMIQ